MHWFAAFLLLYALGTCFGVALVPVRELGRRFFAIHLLIAAALAVAGLAFARPFLGGAGTPLGHGLAAAFVAATLAALGVSCVRSPNAALLWLPVALGSAWAAVEAGSVLPAAHLLSTAAVLGGALVAMALGHWYLNDASLSFAPLTRLCAAFLASAVAKCVVVAILLVPTWRQWWGTLTTDFDGLLVLARVGAGCLAAVVFAWMALSCARIKSNQSATGILYVAVVFSIVGEVISISSTLGKGRLL